MGVKLKQDTRSVRRERDKVRMSPTSEAVEILGADGCAGPEAGIAGDLSVGAAPARRAARRILPAGLQQWALVFVDQGMRSASTFAAGLLLGRACARAEYGFYTLFFSILVSAAAFHAGLVGTPYVALSASKDERSLAAYLGSVVVFQTVLLLVAAFVLVALALMEWVADVTPVPAALYVCFAMALVSVLFRDFVRQLLLADLHVWSSLLLTLAVQTPMIVLLVVLYWTRVLGVGTTFCTMAVCSAVPAIVVLVRMRARMHLERALLAGHVRENWRLGRWLTARASVNLVAGPLYGWVLFASAGPAAVGLYGACMMPALFLSPMCQALSAFGLPKASRAATRGLPQVRRVVMAIAAALAVPLVLYCVGIYVFSEPLMQVLFAGKYMPAAGLLVLFSAEMAILVISSAADCGLTAIRRTEAGFVAEVLSAAVTVVVGLPLVYLFGVWGVGLGLVASRLISRCYLWLCLLRFTAQGRVVAREVA